MATYWSTIPTGFWSITDPVDALNALRDRESLSEYDSINHRIHVLGPCHKAVIINLTFILASFGDDMKTKAAFINDVKKILRLDIKLN